MNTIHTTADEIEITLHSVSENARKVTVNMLPGGPGRLHRLTDLSSKLAGHLATAVQECYGQFPQADGPQTPITLKIVVPCV